MKKRLLFVILATHAAVLLGLTCFEIISPQNTKKTRLDVHTIVIHSKQEDSTHETAKQKKNTNAKIAQTQSTHRKKEKTTAKKPKQTAKKNNTHVEQLLKETIAKIDLKSLPEKKNSFVKIENLRCEGIENPADSYATRLRDFLQKILSFPESGEVKVNLAIKQNGSVHEVTIVSATSEANRHYVESILPTLQFPTPEIDESLCLTLTDEQT